MFPRLILLLEITIMYVLWVTCAATTDSGSAHRLNGRNLIQLGTRLNKPFLKLIGKSLLNARKEMEEDVSEKVNQLEQLQEEKEEAIKAEMCRLHPCSDWTNWSKCDVPHVGDFGGQNRSRRCVLNTTLCAESLGVSASIAYESRICEGEFSCPANYTWTKNSFCVKLYDSDAKSWDDAETACQGDGGHLLNMGSADIFSDVIEVIDDASYANDILWIDGRRNVQAGPWEYSVEQADPSFAAWKSGEPSNGTSELCKIFAKSGSNWYWYDRECSRTYAYMCQII